MSTNPFASTKFDDLAEESADDLTIEDDLPPLFKDPQRVAMAKALKRNGGRLRENLKYINGNMCKDSEGNWSKWVLERCSNSERLAYDTMSELCKQDPVTS